MRARLKSRVLLLPSVNFSCFACHQSALIGFCMSLIDRACEALLTLDRPDLFSLFQSKKIISGTRIITIATQNLKLRRGEIVVLAHLFSCKKTQFSFSSTDAESVALSTTGI